MKIYFTATISGRKIYKKNFETIVREIKKMGYTVIADHILKTDPKERLKETLEERKRMVGKIESWIKNSDIMVTEVSYPSTNVGYEISKALDEEKPVLALHVEGKCPFLLLGVKSDKLRMASYNLSNIREVLEINIEDLRDQVDTRFNFFISPDISRYLNWIAKKRKTPRAVFLRGLIKKAMKEDKRYQKEE